MTKEKTDIVLFETKDKSVSLPVEVKGETVWLNRKQLSQNLRQFNMKEKER